MDPKKNKILSLITFGAFLLAVPLGLFLPELAKGIEAFGTIYVNLLKIMIVPVLFFSISSSLSQSETKVTKITLGTVLVFVLMFALSFLLCALLWIVLKPGVGAVFTETAWEGETKEITLSGFLSSLFPQNIIAAMSENALLPVIIFAFVFGIAVRSCQLQKLSSLCRDLNTAMNKMLSYVLYVTPLGVLALFSNTVAAFGGKVLGTAALYIGCAYLGCLLIAFFVMILPVWVFCGITPFAYIKRVYKVWIMTLSTCSSQATLPLTIRVCNEEFGIPEKVTNIVVPLGCTIHMCGGAVSFSLLAFFNMQMFGIAPAFGTFLLMFVAALLLNMGAPGIPGGGIVIGATYLSILGVPLDFIGFYSGIYRLLDMPYTTMNVCGDITANILIDKIVKRDSEKETSHAAD